MENTDGHLTAQNLHHSAGHDPFSRGFFSWSGTRLVSGWITAHNIPAGLLIDRRRRHLLMPRVGGIPVPG
jgi:hypothetical protein